MCLTSSGLQMPNMISYKSISKETGNKPTSHGKENTKRQAERQNLLPAGKGHSLE